MAEENSSRPIVKIVIVVACLLVAGVAALFAMRSLEAPRTGVIYYDLKTQKLFKAVEQIPPIAIPGEPAGGEPRGVLATMYSCGECSDASKRYVAWLSDAKPEARTEMEKHFVPAAATSVPGGRTEMLISVYPTAWLIKAVEDSTWVESNSPEADDIRAKALQKCAGTEPKPCGPNDFSP